MGRCGRASRQCPRPFPEIRAGDFDGELPQPDLEPTAFRGSDAEKFRFLGKTLEVAGTEAFEVQP